MVVPGMALPNFGMAISEYIATQLPVLLGGGEIYLCRTFDPTFRRDQRREITRHLKSMENDLGVEYISILGSPFFDVKPEDFDFILFWGDFLHSEHYATSCVGPLDLELLDISSSEATARLSNNLFLSNVADSHLKRVYICGQSLLHNSATAYLNKQYVNELTRLYTESSCAWVRDLPSAQCVAEMTANPRRNYLGPDVASLVSLLPQFSADLPDNRDKIAVCFGRGLQGDSSCYKFAATLSHFLALTCQEFPWLFVESKDPESHSANTVQKNIVHVLQELRTFRAVLTDIYHLSVIAWALGIPAVCIIGHESKIPFDQSTGWFDGRRDKRYEFFSSIDALPFLVELKDLQRSQDLLESRAQILALALEDVELCRRINMRVVSRARVGLMDLMRVAEGSR